MAIRASYLVIDILRREVTRASKAKLDATIRAEPSPHEQLGSA